MNEKGPKSLYCQICPPNVKPYPFCTTLINECTLVVKYVDFWNLVFVLNFFMANFFFVGIASAYAELSYPVSRMFLTLSSFLLPLLLRDFGRCYRDQGPISLSTNSASSRLQHSPVVVSSKLEPISLLS